MPRSCLYLFSVYYKCMSELLQCGITIVTHAEGELRRLLGEAATAGDYDSLLTIADWARQLRGLVDNGATRADGASDRKQAMPGSPTSRASQPRAQDARAARAKRRARATRRSTTSRSEYPRFLRDGNQLVKIGWSKSEKTTYEHRAPRHFLDLVVAALRRCGEKGRRFTMEDALPVTDPEDGTEVPIYQAYLCLAWLRKEGLVEQHGRQGYSLPAAAHLDALAAKRFDELTPR